MTGPLFAPDANLLETVIAAAARTERTFDLERSGAVVVHPGPFTGALANEMLASCQDALRAAYLGSCAAPGKPAEFLWVHDPCGEWRLMTKQRSTSVCGCEDKTKRRQLVIPWTRMNRHGRPINPHYQKVTPVTSKPLPSPTPNC